MRGRGCINHLIERLPDYATTNQILLMCDGYLRQARRENYYPGEDGVLHVHAQEHWEPDGYSVGELLELLKKYGDRVDDIEFHWSDTESFEFLNLLETMDNAGVVFYTVVLIGLDDESKPFPPNMRRVLDANASVHMVV